MEGALHPLAAQGFSRDAATYDRGRPDYPTAAVDRIAERFGLGPESRVVDLAAGTGKLTRMLVGRGLRPVAVEPLAEMRKPLASIRGARPVGGTAEVLPFRDACLDAVLVAQAFHWFDAPRAAAEIRRVLRPGGGLAVLWNRRDETVPWVADLGRILDGLAGDAPRVQTDDWRAPFDAGCGFSPLALESFPHVQALTAAGMLDRVGSVSYVAVLPEARRRELLDEVRDLLQFHPSTRGREVLELPYRTDLFLADRPRT